MTRRRVRAGDGGQLLRLGAELREPGIGLAGGERAQFARGAGKEVDDAGIMSMLQGMVKQRQESIELYRKGKRDDLVTKEQGEIAIIERYLPKPLSDAEMEQVVAQTIGRTGAASIRDMGKVIGALREEYAGRMDFARASQLVKARLGT